MNPKKLDDLLPGVFQEEPCMPGNDCLSLKSIYTLAERPGRVSEKERRHFLTCSICRERVARVRRDRDIINAPVVEDAKIEDGTNCGVHRGQASWQAEAGVRVLSPAAKNGIIKI